MKRSNIIFGSIGCGLSLYVFWATSSFPSDAVMNIGPDFFPRLIAAGLFIFSGVLIVSNLLSREEDTVVRFDIKDPGVQRAGIALLASIVYGLLVETFGFILTTIVYLVFLMYVMKLRKWKKMGLVAVMVSLLVFLVFRVFLHITLPDGFWA